jgi:hypothetical protein
MLVHMWAHMHVMCTTIFSRALTHLAVGQTWKEDLRAATALRALFSKALSVNIKK